MSGAARNGYLRSMPTPMPLAMLLGSSSSLGRFRPA
jgi:hypothetical protein